MKLNEILVREACVVDMKARTKKEALRELSEVLAGSVKGLDGAGLLDMLLEREKLGTTAMGDGIAIPHARIEALERLLASFGRSRQGVDFDSVDGKPTHLFFLLVAPGREGSAHLLTLARLSRMLSSPEFRSKLLDVESNDDFFRVLEEEESRQ
ncbi:MAG: PTS sugar transporter subunit IIA [Deltaproteobacteria bacterium]|nr:PTS sugar transporter subunit IIA [Myxococcales bacterium]MCZ6570591.1 PTS sugar transporter subunit IIA [Deltaproteobacteria bacterium]MCZ6713094.1 PTS sugar transporter subunit IIA [Deltaproteobacteria bacterium]TDJ03057.1 MAG: PTS sugar transporter subunit IIA [Deltaproteobacteria bacterium]TDJ05993.1 MAG: PTS sugar transporter subunit IIA [Deltaproteobacteria bacterium]